MEKWNKVSFKTIFTNFQEGKGFRCSWVKSEKVAIHINYISKLCRHKENLLGLMRNINTEVSNVNFGFVGCTYKPSSQLPSVYSVFKKKVVTGYLRLLKR